jgi:hypothetical protein
MATSGRDLNGPEAYGKHPGRPVIYRIPTTGSRPSSAEASSRLACLCVPGR